jgi:hypothetical protein
MIIVYCIIEKRAGSIGWICDGVPFDLNWLPRMAELCIIVT